MGKAFTQVTMEERCEIARLRAQGSSIRQVAGRCGSPAIDGGSGAEAQRFPHAGLPAPLCQPAGPRPSLAGLPAGAGRSAAGAGPRRSGRGLVSGAGGRASRAGRGAADHLPRRASTGSSTPRWRGRRTTPGGTTCPGPRPSAAFGGRRGGSPVTHITLRVPLSQRPHAAADRATFGHWEGDLMHFGNHGPALLALAERHSRLVLLARLPGKGADVTADTIAPPAGPPPPGVAPDHHLRQRHRVRPPLPPPPPWASRLSSAIPAPPGRRGAWRTPSAAYGARCPAKPGWLTSPKRPLRGSSSCTTIPPRKCLGYRTPAETLDDQVVALGV